MRLDLPHTFFDVLILDYDVVITVSPGLLVEEAESMVHLMLKGAVPTL